MSGEVYGDITHTVGRSPEGVWGGIRLTHVFVTAPYLLHPCTEIHVMFILSFVGEGWGVEREGGGFHRCLYDLWIYKSNCPTTHMYKYEFLDI